MAQVFKIVKENKEVVDEIKSLNKRKANVKELIYIIRTTDGSMEIHIGNSSFETMCSGSKMLDYMITQDLAVDNGSPIIELDEEE